MNKVLSGILIALFASAAWAAPSLFEVAEARAEIKAEVNATRIRCLNYALEVKFQADKKLGRIQDWGNLRSAVICEDYIYDPTREYIVTPPKNGGQLIPQDQVKPPLKPLKKADLVQEEIDRATLARMEVGVQDARSCN